MKKALRKFLAVIAVSAFLSGCTARENSKTESLRCVSAPSVTLAEAPVIIPESEGVSYITTTLA